MITITLDRAVFAILRDEFPESPRDWDHLSTMVCWHRRYALGDQHAYQDPQAFRADIHDGNAVILPLYLFDHSGLTLSTASASFRACDPAGWDWGQVGYVYATLADIRREYGVRRVTRGVRAKAEDALRDEVTSYDQFLRGDVYGFVLTDRATGDEIDACWGFYGSDPTENGMADHLPAEYREAILGHFRRAAA